jgi:hypothetical protein
MATKNLARTAIEGCRSFGVFWHSLPDWFRKCHDPFAASGARHANVS